MSGRAARRAGTALSVRRGLIASRGVDPVPMGKADRRRREPGMGPSREEPRVLHDDHTAERAVRGRPSAPGSAGPAPADDGRVDVATHRAAVVRRLLDRGLRPDTLAALVPDLRPLIEGLREDD